MELAPFPLARNGCRGFTGPVPPPLSMCAAMSEASIREPGGRWQAARVRGAGRRCGGCRAPARRPRRRRRRARRRPRRARRAAPQRTAVAGAEGEVRQAAARAGRAGAGRRRRAARPAARSKAAVRGREEEPGEAGLARGARGSGRRGPGSSAGAGARRRSRPARGAGRRGGRRPPGRRRPGRAGAAGGPAEEDVLAELLARGGAEPALEATEAVEQVAPDEEVRRLVEARGRRRPRATGRTARAGRPDPGRRRPGRDRPRPSAATPAASQPGAGKQSASVKARSAARPRGRPGVAGGGRTRRRPRRAPGRARPPGRSPTVASRRAVVDDDHLAPPVDDLSGERGERPGERGRRVPGGDDHADGGGTGGSLFAAPGPAGGRAARVSPVRGPDMRRFWDERAREDAFFFVDDRLTYRHPDLDSFWRGGEEALDGLLGRLRRRPDRRGGGGRGRLRGRADDAGDRRRGRGRSGRSTCRARCSTSPGG